MYEFERILGVGLASMHHFVFWGLKTMAMRINVLFLFICFSLFNDLHPAFHCHLTSTDTCTLFIVVLEQFNTPVTRLTCSMT